MNREANQEGLGGSALGLATLVLAGESIFLLPFVLPRVFRPTLLAVLQIDNLQLGKLFSVYGVVALLAYLLGGPLADRFRPHQLLATALVLTACGGFYLAQVPSLRGLYLMYAGWGLSTILLFWAAMLRATRLLGRARAQGRAFGWLEGGRGLLSALIATGGVALLQQFLPGDVGAQGAVAGGAPDQQQAYAFTVLVNTLSSLVLLAALCVYVVLRRLPEVSAQELKVRDAFEWRRLASVARLPAVWRLALVILCAYSGYRVLDNVSLLGFDVLNYSEAGAAGLGSANLYIRPLASISAGFLADRYSASRMSTLAFVLSLVGTAVVSIGLAAEVRLAWPILLGIGLVSLGVYALRGLYFALTAEGNVPVEVTGTAIGLASLVGYLPDIYMAPLTGYLIDTYPGGYGHLLTYIVAAIFMLVGGLIAGSYRRIRRASVV